jgi:hypothetical protein
MEPGLIKWSTSTAVAPPAKRFLDAHATLADAKRAQKAYDAFRKAYGLTGISHRTYPDSPELSAIMPGHIIGRATAANGHCPVLLAEVGQMNLQRLDEFGRDKLMKSHAMLMEHLLQLHDTNIMVCDMRGFTASHLLPSPLGMLGEMSRMDDQYYPRLTRRVLVINVPWMLRMSWHVVSPLLGAFLVQHITIIDDDDGGKAILRDVLDAPTAELVCARMG